MRRQEKEITDVKEIEQIIAKAKVCRLAFAENNIPYIVPVCFGYKSNTIYFHSAGNGKKVDMIRVNNKVCFEFDVDSGIVESEDPCKWGMKYRSVIGLGHAVFIEDRQEKQKALAIIMQNYTDKTFTFPDGNLKHTCVVKISIEQISGKESGY